MNVPTQGDQVFVGIADARNVGPSDLMPHEAMGAFVRFAAHGPLAQVRDLVEAELRHAGLQLLALDDVREWAEGNDEHYRYLVDSLSDDRDVVLGDTFSYEVDDE